MASVRDDGNGRRSLQFKHPATGKRQTLRLGKATAKQADSIRAKVEALLAAKLAGLPLDGETASWLGQCGDDLLWKLATAGLCAERRSALLGPFTREYIDGRSGVKPRTLIGLETARTSLVALLGEDKPLRDITPGDGDRWHATLTARYKPSTVGRMVRRAREFFSAAIRRKLLTASPFVGVKTTGHPDAERRRVIGRPAVAAVMEQLADPELRPVLALARFGGLRVPTEIQNLRWQDVDWEKGRFLVRSPKTEAHAKGGRRWVPIFPELEPHFRDAFERAEDGATFVVNHSRGRNAAQLWRKLVCRAIERAGLEVWPKLFNNLRASRAGELAEQYPIHVAAEWLGHSPRVALEHYCQATAADFERARHPDAKSDATPTQSDAKTDAARSGPEVTGRTEGVEIGVN